MRVQVPPRAPISSKENCLNIFYLHKDPVKAARMQCDQHVVKMIIESAQMLSLAHITWDKRKDAPYYGSMGSHPNHPSSLWARQNRSNYIWLWKLFKALSKEYTYRYNKEHKTWREHHKYLRKLPVNLPKGSFTPPYQAMPEQYRNKNAVVAYRNFYIHEKSKFARWRNKRKPPKWYTEALDSE